MIFNSLQYAFFLPIVFLLYWFVFNKTYKVQNGLLLIVSYFFYSCWDWRFLFLLFFSTLSCFFVAIMIDQSKYKKTWVFLGIFISLLFLFFFKYFNFFVVSFSELLISLGITPHMTTLNIILPVGISFYTFHGLSYIIDVYKKRIPATTDFIGYGLFVSFFPLLVAGPIERATHLLPQIQRERQFSYSQSVDGLRQILWGLVKKVIIADNCAIYADLIFNNSADYNSSTLIIGAILFSFQIYGDFSGYTDIALGSAKLLGFNLLQNFNYPYFSRTVGEFWKKWHISLTSWFRDYLYIPLGGSREGLYKTVRNTFIIFIVSGFWHGANWTYVIWGLLNALFILPSILKKKKKKLTSVVAENNRFPTLNEFLQILSTFILITFAWIFFRANSLNDAFMYIKYIFTKSVFQRPDLSLVKQIMPISILLVLFLLVEWIGRRNKYALEEIQLVITNKMLRLGFYYILVALIIIFSGVSQQFIYFQF